jgi:hypothetical protein
MTRIPSRRTCLNAIAFGAIALTSSASLMAQRAPSGFTSIFDGRTLKGWKGDMKVWSVRDGAITASTDNPITHNTYLVLDKPYANFELRYKYRWLTDVGNSGIQFRSGMGEGNYVMAGMQANVTPVGKPERFAMLYDELGDRQEMVLLGQRAEVTRHQATSGGRGRIVRTVLNMVNPRDAIIKSVKPKDWNEGVLIVQGNRIVHVVNGFVAFDAIDKDPLTQRDGLIGFQAHSGPPMTVQFKDLAIRPLTSFPSITGYKSSPSPAPAPARTYKDSTNVGMEDPAFPG